MSEHPCIKEKELDRLTRSVFGGNGEEGLKVKLARIDTNLSNVKETVDEINKTVSTLTNEEIRSKTTETIKERMQMTARQKTKIYMSLIISGAAVIISLLQYFK